MEPFRAKRLSYMPTSELSREQVQELKRATLGDDPLVELAIEAHTVGASEVHDGNQVNLAGRRPPTSPPPAQAATPAPNPGATLVGVGRAGDAPPRPRMPSPTPPSLQPPGEAPPVVRVVSAPHMTSALVTGPVPAPGTVQSLAPPPPRAVGGGPPINTGTLPTLKKSKWPLGVAALVVVGIAAGSVTWQVMQKNDKAGEGSGAPVGSNGATNGSSQVVHNNNNHDTGSGSGSVIAASASATGSGKGSAIATATGSGKGSAAGAAGAGSAAKPIVSGTPTGDALQISSTPGGARVFIAGADQGVTPVKLSGSAAR